ncbi:MAG: cache domain-containing protein [Desulfuromonadales bacterium]|nr:cache domain-containing protein [Desulfuromonadales bacterium]
MGIYSKSVLLLWLGIALAGQVKASEHATPYEVVKKVEAAVTLLAQNPQTTLPEFSDPSGRWVWKDTYLFVLDCSRITVAAHPVSPKLIGNNHAALQDVRGKLFFKEFCQAPEKGAWIDYYWPKPGEEQASRKISYIKAVSGSVLRVGGGLYEENLKVEELMRYTQEMLQAETEQN